MRMKWMMIHGKQNKSFIKTLKMKKRLIDYHYEWMEKRRMHDCGLCHSLPEKYKKTFELFYPPELSDWGILVNCWAADIEYNRGNDDKVSYGYGKTRQTIVLFICAMHNEL